MFQFSMWSACLYIEISKCSSEGYIDSSGQHIQSNKVKVYQIGGGSPFNRTRIGDDSFEFDEGNSEEVSRKVLTSLGESE
jgi:hypothetical protein